MIITKRQLNKIIKINLQNEGVRDKLAMLMSSTKTMSNDEEQLDLDDEDYYEESEEAELQKLISDVEAECSAGNDPACEELETLYDDLEKIKSEIATNIEIVARFFPKTLLI